MKVTESRYKNRQLHIEDYLQMVSAEQKEYAEVFDYSKITEKSSVITDYWTNNLLDLILRKGNLNNAYKQVKKNKGKGGIDGMQVDELLPFLRENQRSLIQKIREGKYKPNPVRRVEIPKETKGEYRQLGIPTVVDRVIQQAIAQELTPIYEEQFSENSFGFRPGRGAHDALRQCQKNVDEGYVYVIDMDLEKFFDTVSQSKLIEVLSRTIKDGRVISLIHKYLNAGVIADGIFERTEVGMPQGGPLSPLLSNVMLNELDKELERRGHRFVRYADDCMILCKSKKSAERTLRNIIPFIGGEEEKSEQEPLRLWGKVEDGVIKKATTPVITTQCIRVPVLDGHTAAVFVKFKKNPTKEQLIEALKNFSGVPQELKLPSAPEHFIQYLEEDNRPQIALDVNYENGMGISVGRLREDTVYDWKFVGLSHNTVRGAAGGAVLCAELLKAQGYITAK